ncbi:MAG: LPS export ABC transporter permease LptF [Gammaproteobacteria bacterium]
MILRRYLIREVVVTFLGVFILILAIFVSLKVVDYLAQAAAGRMPVGAIVTLVGLLIVSNLALLSPICLVVAIPFALGRMQRDNEIIAMANAGIGSPFVHRYIFQLTGLFALAVAACSLFFGPWALGEMRDLRTRAEQESDITGVTPGRFKELGDGDRVLFVKSLSTDKRDLEDVFLQDRKGQRLSVLAASKAEVATEEGTGHRYALFHDGSSYKGIPGQADYEVTHYESLGWRIDQSSQNKVADNVKSASSFELLLGEDPANSAELQWRISVPIMTLLSSIFAVSLLSRVGRGNRYSQILVTVLLYFTYSNLLGVGRTMIKKEHVPAIVGIWWVHLLVIAVIVLMEKYPDILRAWRESRRAQQQLLPS